MSKITDPAHDYEAPQVDDLDNAEGPASVTAGVRQVTPPGPVQ